MKYCGGTFSDPTKVDKVANWGPCADLSEVRAFLGTIGVVRVFIKNFARLAHPLTRKGTPFVFRPELQDALKAVLLASPTLRPIDYDSDSPVILGVDTSAIGFLLCQCDADNPRIRRYARFGSITLNDHESRFSQPKLELSIPRPPCSKNVSHRSPELSSRGGREIHWHVSYRVPGMGRMDFRGVHSNQAMTLPIQRTEFDGWVEQVYGFMHFLNPLGLTVAHPEICVTYVSETLSECSTNHDR